MSHKFFFFFFSVHRQAPVVLSSRLSFERRREHSKEDGLGVGEVVSWDSVVWNDKTVNTKSATKFT